MNDVRVDPETGTATIRVCRFHDLACEARGLDLEQRKMAEVIAIEFENAGLPELAVPAIVSAWAESHLNPDAVSPSGSSIGLFQLHKDGAGMGMSVNDRRDPVKNTKKILDEIRSYKGRRLCAAADRGAPADELICLFTIDVMAPKNREQKAEMRVEILHDLFPGVQETYGASSEDMAKTISGAYPKCPLDLARRIVEVATHVGAHPYTLANLIHYESAGTFSPSVKNPNSTARGLIQFIEPTAQSLGTSTAKLAAMTALEQMDVVETYLMQYKSRDLSEPINLYMAVFTPDAIGNPDYVFSAKTQKNNGGIRTPRDYEKRVLAKAAGRLPSPKGTPTLTSVAPPSTPEGESAWWDPWAWIQSMVGGPATARVKLDEGFSLTASDGTTHGTGDVPPGNYQLLYRGKRVIPSVSTLAGRSYRASIQGREYAWEPLGAVDRSSFGAVESGQVGKNFTWNEARNPSSSTVRENCVALAENVLDPIRELVGRPVHITSWYRSPESNRACGGAARSQHLTGEAADFHVDGIPAPELAARILKAGIPFDNLIWYWSIHERSIPGKPAIHVTWRRTGSPRRKVLRYVGENDYRREMPPGVSSAPAPAAPSREVVEEEDAWDPWAWVSSLFFGESTVQMDAAFSLVDSTGKSHDAGSVPPGRYALVYHGKTLIPQVTVLESHAYRVYIDGDDVVWQPLGTEVFGSGGTMTPEEAAERIEAAYHGMGKMNLELARAIVQVAIDVGLHPFDLANVMRAESQFWPNICSGQDPKKYPSGRFPFVQDTAVGMIQITPYNAKRLNTSTQKIHAMNAVDQMEVIKRYFTEIVIPENGKPKGSYQTAMAVFFRPAMKYHPDTDLGDKIGMMNQGIRTPRQYMRYRMSHAKLPASEEAPGVAEAPAQEPDRAPRVAATQVPAASPTLYDRAVAWWNEDASWSVLPDAQDWGEWTLVSASDGEVKTPGYLPGGTYRLQLDGHPVPRFPEILVSPTETYVVDLDAQGIVEWRST